MPTILSYVAVSNGAPTRASFEVLTRCRRIADEQGGDLAAVVLAPDADALADEAARYGASTVYTVSHPIFKNPLNTPMLDALATVIERAGPAVVAFPSTEGVKDVLGALAGVSEGALKDGKSVSLPGIGKLEASERAAREVRNPQTGEKKMSEAHMAPKFKFSTTFKSAVRG